MSWFQIDDGWQVRTGDWQWKPQEFAHGGAWMADRITAAGREKLREAGLAPPAPRSAGPTTLVQLQSKAFRCPYCSSTDTRLENIFGPTPCRSIRWCESCRQPFEQFKTI